MSIIIRLQNLPWSARSVDIRQFFGGLRIPDGGVHIIGGEKGDAFIAFNSDEDARLAMQKDGGKIKDACIKLLLSSHMEMQNLIERITKQPFPKSSESQTQASKERTRSPTQKSRTTRSPDSKSRRSRSPHSDTRRGRSPHSDTRRGRSPHSDSRRGRSPHSDTRRGRSPHSDTRRGRSPHSDTRRGRSPDHKSRRGRSPVRRQHESSPRSGSRSQHHSRDDSRGQKRSRSPIRRSSKSPLKGQNASVRSNYPPDPMKEQRDVHILKSSDEFSFKQSGGNEQQGFGLQQNNFKTDNMYARQSPLKEPQFFNTNNQTTGFQKMPESLFAEKLPDFNIPFPSKEGNQFQNEGEINFQSPNSGNNNNIFSTRIPQNDFPGGPSPHMQSIINQLSGTADPQTRQTAVDDWETLNMSHVKPNDVPPYHQNKPFDDFSNQPKLSDTEYGRPPNSEPFNKFEQPNMMLPPPPFPNLPPFMSQGSNPNMMQEGGPAFPKLRQESDPVFTNIRQESGPAFSNVRQESGPPFRNMMQESDPAFHNMRRESGPSFPDMRQESGPSFPNMMQESDSAFPGMRRESGPAFPDMRQESGPAFSNMRQELGPAFPNRMQESDSGCQNYCIRIMGLEPSFTFRDLQAVLRGIYAPQNHIQWELDDQMNKTGTAFVKLTNRDDFRKVLAEGKYLLRKYKIKVNHCPNHLREKYFPDNPNQALLNSPSMQHQNDLCYMLKGLPFSVTYDDVIHFFRGLRIADMFIIYDKAGKATGTGYVEFFDQRDFSAAIEMNGKKIAHRYIELLPSCRRDIMKSKEKFGDQNPSDTFFKPTEELPGRSFHDSKVPQHQLLNRKPLCALLTGLPLSIKNTDIIDFFSNQVGLKPFAIHIMLNNKHQPNGRAFVEILNPLEFESALKCHGRCIDNNVICVKQVLHDEMIKILDTQEAKHHFENMVSKDQLNLPEKVPWLWEPPDAEDCDLTSEADKNDLYDEDYYDRKPYNSRERFPNERIVQDYGHSAKRDFPMSNVSENFQREIPREAPYSNRSDSFQEQQSDRFRSESINFPTQERTFMRNRGNEPQEPFFNEMGNMHRRNEPQKPFFNEMGNVDRRNDPQKPFFNEMRNMHGNNEHQVPFLNEMENVPKRNEPQEPFFNEMENVHRRNNPHLPFSSDMRNLHGRNEPEEPFFNEMRNIHGRNKSPEPFLNEMGNVHRRNEPVEPFFEQMGNMHGRKDLQEPFFSERGNMHRRNEPQEPFFSEMGNVNRRNEPQEPFFSEMGNVNRRNEPQEPFFNEIRNMNRRNEPQEMGNMHRRNEPQETGNMHRRNEPQEMGNMHRRNEPQEIGNMHRRNEPQEIRNMHRRNEPQEMGNMHRRNEPQEMGNMHRRNEPQEMGNMHRRSEPQESRCSETIDMPSRQSHSSKEENRSNFQNPLIKKGGSNEKNNRGFPSEIASTPVIPDDSRIPVKFEVKIKQTVATSKNADEAFDRELTKTDNKRKLSRLSPDKSNGSTNKDKGKVVVKTEKSLKEEEKGPKSKLSTEVNKSSNLQKPLSDDKNKDHRGQSPKRSVGNSKKSVSNSERKDDKGIEKDKVKDKGNVSPTRKGSSNSKIISSNEKGKSNYERLRTAERKTDDNRHQRSSSARDRSSHRNESTHSSESTRNQIKDDRKDPAPSVNTSCTVQLSNVHPVIGLEELVDFFHNFDLEKDKIIRRYTDFGDPTGDVRVCFKNSSDAEKAIKLLNRENLGGIPVQMFLV